MSECPSSSRPSAVVLRQPTGLLPGVGCCEWRRPEPAVHTALRRPAFGAGCTPEWGCCLRCESVSFGEEPLYSVPRFWTWGAHKYGVLAVLTEAVLLDASFEALRRPVREVAGKEGARSREPQGSGQWPAVRVALGRARWGGAGWMGLLS